MSKPEHSGFSNLTWTAPVNPKPSPGGAPISPGANSQTFGDWVKRGSRVERERGDQRAEVLIGSGTHMRGNRCQTRETVAGRNTKERLAARTTLSEQFHHLSAVTFEVELVPASTARSSSTVGPSGWQHRRSSTGSSQRRNSTTGRAPRRRRASSS